MHAARGTNILRVIFQCFLNRASKIRIRFRWFAESCYVKLNAAAVESTSVRAVKPTQLAYNWLINIQLESVLKLRTVFAHSGVDFRRKKQVCGTQLNIYRSLIAKATNDCSAEWSICIMAMDFSLLDMSGKQSTSMTYGTWNGQGLVRVSRGVYRLDINCWYIDGYFEHVHRP